MKQLFLLFITCVLLQASFSQTVPQAIGPPSGPLAVRDTFILANAPAGSTADYLLTVTTAGVVRKITNSSTLR